MEIARGRLANSWAAAMTMKAPFLTCHQYISVGEPRELELIKGSQSYPHTAARGSVEEILRRQSQKQVSRFRQPGGGGCLCATRNCVSPSQPGRQQNGLICVNVIDAAQRERFRL